MKSLKISVGHWIILLSLIYIFDRTKLRELYTKFYVGETSYLLFAALCLQRSYIYGAFPFAWFPRVMKKSGIFTFDFKKIQKSGRKKTKSSNIFQIVRCILFIIVFITLGFLIQRVNLVTPKMNVGCGQNIFLFAGLYREWKRSVNLTDVVRKKSVNFILRCEWEPCICDGSRFGIIISAIVCARDTVCMRSFVRNHVDLI